MTTLPNGYREVRRVDLMRNRKEAVIVNLLALLITGALAVLGFVFCPPFVEITIGIHTIINMVIWMIGIIAYMIFHELIHGVFMKTFSGKKPHYGFTGLYAYAGSDAFFARKQYLVIAFAPVVILGLVIRVLTIGFYEAAVCDLYLLHVVNLSGAAGDFYVGFLIARAGDDVIVQDMGTDMSFYSAR